MSEIRQPEIDEFWKTCLPKKPSIADVMEAVSFHFLVMSSAALSKGHISQALTWLYEATDAQALGQGEFMWVGGAEHQSESFKGKALSSLGKTGANARHASNRDAKLKVFNWCDENISRFSSMDAAAFDIAETFVPQKFRTVRDWMTEWNKQRSTGKA